mmetsp:Transcript_18808/g.49994  ORF Transcript_18808/g.49994 Transcript_18808/m.49994 type:complete len:130 (+) Transcript_18808:100-489(+)
MAKSSTRPLREVKLLLLVACGAYLVSYLMELAGLANVRAGGKKEVAPVIPGVSAGTSQQKASPKAPQQRNSGGSKPHASAPGASKPGASTPEASKPAASKSGGKKPVVSKSAVSKPAPSKPTAEAKKTR